MKKFILLFLVVFAYFYYSHQDTLPSKDQILSYLNLKSSQAAPQVVSPVQKESTNLNNKVASIPTSAKEKYPTKNIQTYQVTVNNGKLVVDGKPTPYGKFYHADGVILYIDEPRANKKETIKVPFKNGRVHYEYPLIYTVGDVILNLNEYYKGKADNPNEVLGYAEYHLTDGDPYLQPSYMVQSNDPTLIALAQNITYGKKTDSEKSQAIFEWVAKNIAYNAPLVNSPNPPLYSALKTYNSGVVLCSGYADLSAALHRAVGIEAKVDYGENHAWNEVNINGVWQTEDPTYGSGYINANTMKFVHNYQPAYFYKSDKHKEGEYPW
ncbi:transglutaminase domain-containing protein [Neobacillus massiliamazoniensis]|uniref:Transglutaminase domain-containing protein n=1 Tax=Neobacillus massiliamazoniensis TaxID=1499688 RepID=A0A0U1NYF9_9BACI|nr:transglutaminase-like domain-containing protein [Neobacillus massiliamazoniensis]CRK83070.1 transglutaminase domain-containing protein [Neobacillus massiliamazoniensis]